MTPLCRIPTLLAVALADGLIGLDVVPADAWRLRGARAPIPDPPTLPSKKQNRPNADRVCLTWTASLEAAKAEAPGARREAAMVASSSNRDADAVGRMS